MLIKMQCCWVTKYFYTTGASEMSRKFCGKTFNRGFNLRRHEEEYCPLKSEEREMSETESQTVDSEDEASSVTTHGSESPMTGDSETEQEEADPWMPMVEEAMQKHKAAFQEMKMNLTHSGLDEQTAGETAYSNILPELQKELKSIYLQRLQWIQQLKKDPVHKKIMQTRDSVVNDDDFDPEEAIEAAVNKRKFLINRHLKDYNFTEDSDDEDY